jgi:transposase InsO family protein
MALLRAEIRIKDARMAALAPHRRPHYPPPERLEILELRAARGWSVRQTADAFLVTPATVASWMGRLDEEGPAALVRLRTPVNKFPDFVRYAVQRLQALCPTLGKKKIAEVLARAGLHLAATTIGRMGKQPPRPRAPQFLPLPLGEDRGEGRALGDDQAEGRCVTGKRPNHVWHIDLTTIPTSAGFWCSWLPFAFPQCWPFCWWIAVVLDHCSRRSMGFAVFHGAPTSVEIRALLGRTISFAGEAPKYLISDKGAQFWPSKAYKSWCKRHGIKPRFGAIGQHGSIAVIERCIRTMKESLRRLVIPLRHEAMRGELKLLIAWYNEHRPHSSLRDRTPNEVYFGRFPANRKPRLEPRPEWPRGSPCAAPRTLVAGQPGGRFTIEVARLAGQMHLPIVKLRRAG